jgi:hypothetical protein
MSQDDLEQMKNDHVTVGDPLPLQGGEDIGSAVAIPGLPYSDGGSTAGALNDYDEICPFSGSTSPDVVYSYSGGLDIDISLCNSGYDTKVYVYENAAGNLVACNDDACGSDGFRSELLCVPTTTPGSTYYIVVDGYGGASGTYDLSVSECTPCIVECPPGGVLEGEVDCFDDYKDQYNGGCNSSPPVFSTLPCSQSMTVCGTYGGFFHSPSGFNYRDTDWYELPAGSNTAGFTFCVTGELETLSGYINAALGCGAPIFEDFNVSGPCDTWCFNVPAGMDAWLFAATANFGAEAGPCGSNYAMTIDGLDCPPISIEPKSWGQIKEQYK